ncbi:thioredoxin [Nitzschia inconspicua]|uniref:Thioredoxin n=1 Tax=Nitzschia inconspicua TaxID=303405 RepID=A0A9K3LNM1_9STRA|nr:thioredoxin [Nitzschia inconspicua]
MLPTVLFLLLSSFVFLTAAAFRSNIHVIHPIPSFVLSPSPSKRPSRSCRFLSVASPSTSDPQQQQDVASSSSSSSSETQNQPTTTIVPIESMRVKELQTELKILNIDYSDCFDKESLVERLKDVREGRRRLSVATSPETNVEPNVSSTDESSTRTHDSGPTTQQQLETKEKRQFDKDSKLQELRSMKVRELREECAKRRIRWAQFVEKEELVQALITSIERSAEFSVSGVMMPGEVTDLTEEQLQEELSQPSEAPLLLDIYATWCGPCQMMAPQLKEAAAQLVNRVRVGKIDSDKYPTMARKLKANGLPTVLVLNGSEELDRIEGAMMKDQILKFVEPYI